VLQSNAAVLPRKVWEQFIKNAARSGQGEKQGRQRANDGKQMAMGITSAARGRKNPRKYEIETLFGRSMNSGGMDLETSSHSTAAESEPR